jgi:hypothetical protein
MCICGILESALFTPFGCHVMGGVLDLKRVFKER